MRCMEVKIQTSVQPMHLLGAHSFRRINWLTSLKPYGSDLEKRKQI